MPIYEYQCDSCGHHLEALQKISDPLLKTCPECGTDSLRKRISAAAFRLKGGGWYETDFKDNKGRKNVAAADDSASAGKQGSSEKKEEKAKSDSGNSDSGTGSGSTDAGKTAAG